MRGGCARHASISSGPKLTFVSFLCLSSNSHWSSIQRGHALFHAGTLPDKKKQTFVCDLRVMVSATRNGFQPLAVYARRARLPLAAKLTSGADSWGMLGTNLSVKKPDGEWATDTSRLLLMDMKDFNKLGIAIDDLIDGYIQTILSTLAIDRMAVRLTQKNGTFDRDLYASLNQDEGLLSEIMDFADAPVEGQSDVASAAAVVVAVDTPPANGNTASAASANMSPVSLARLKDVSEVVLPSPFK